MGTYNGCLLIPLTALQDLSYVATAMLLVRPSPGFALGYTNTTPSPSPALSPCVHTGIKSAIHTHL